MHSSPGVLTSAARLSLLLLLAAVVLRTAWVSDDAFITFRTVDNALNGHGLRWNVAERVQSFTHPLWMLLLLPAVAIVGSPYLASLLLSFVLTAVTVAFLMASARGRPWAVAFGLAVLVFSKAFVDYSTSGLENPLSHALLAALMLTAVSPGKRSLAPGPWPLAPAGPLRALLLGLLVALIGLSRMDLLLIAGPIALAALASSAVRWPLATGPRPLPQHSAFCTVHSALLFLLGLSPLAAWTLFSLAYYGVPFPNTAYAKLATGLPQDMLTIQGLRYLVESLDRDPLTLPVIAAAILAPIVFLVLRVVSVRARGEPLRPWTPLGPGALGPLGPAVSLSLVVYLFYVVRIGGDFMSGRFLAAPLVVAVFALLWLPWPRRALAGLALVLVAAGVGLSAREPSVALLTGPSRLAFEEIWLPSGVVDERSFYFERTAFLTRGGFRSEPDQDDLRPLVADLRDQHPRTIVYQTVGMAGYYVGPDRHIIDTLALCDPLLARLPAIPPWRIGHYQRAIPEGYFESVDTNRNVVQDSELAALYDRIRLATRAPLWTRERWRAIWRLNVGSAS